MWTFVARRIFWTIFLVLGASFLVFLTLHLAPGDPAHLIAGENAPPETIARIRERLGLNQPIHVQYGRYLVRVLHGDFGRSLHSDAPVANQLLVRIPVTVTLALYAMLVGLPIGLIAGIIAAVHPRTLFDQLSMVLSLIGASLPVFWFGLLLLYTFAVKLRWFPVSGGTTLEYFVLPAIALGLRPAATIARLTRASLLEVLSEDYVRTAHAKGLAQSIVILKHGLRNAAIPVVTAIGVLLGGLLAGSVVTEVVFGLPGLGSMLVTNILNRDFPMVQGPLLLIAGMFTLVNLLVDLSYGILDPTIQYG